MKTLINEQNILQIRTDFPIFVNNPNLIYFDNAATSQIPRTVVQKMNDYYYNYKANVGRTSGKIATKSDNSVENIRSKIAKFFGVQSCEIIYTSGSTESLNLTAISLYKYFKKLETDQKINQSKKLKELKIDKTNSNLPNNSRRRTNHSNLVFGGNSQNNIESNFKAKSEVIITQIEHHSNFLVWQEYFETKIWKIRKDTFWLEDLEKLINENTKILTIMHASNFTGQILPIKEIIKRVRTISPEICVVLDGSQAVLNLPIDLKVLDCDFYCFSGHKILAPNGIGVLWTKEKWLQILEPPKFGGGMVGTVNFETEIESSEENNKQIQTELTILTQNQSLKNKNKKIQDKIENEIGNERESKIKHSTWQPFPHSWEAGTPNIAGIIGLGTAFDYFENLEKKYDLMSWKIQLWNYLKDKIEQIPDITIINSVLFDKKFCDNSDSLDNLDKNSRQFPNKFPNQILTQTQIPILTFYHTQINSFDLTQLLASFQICLRSGSLCCQPFLASLETSSVIRISLNFYNTKSEIDFFVDKLKEVIEILK